MTNDAPFIIAKFGGVNALAQAIDKNPATVYRWTYPKEKGGTGGLIPSASLLKIQAAANLLNINLSRPTDTPSYESDPSQPQQFVHWFRNSAPYIQAHRGKTFVISFSGEAVRDPFFSNLIKDISLLHSLGIKLILVHGIRPQLEARLTAKGQTGRLFKNLRVTDKDTLELAKESTGVVRANIEAQLSVQLANTAVTGTHIQVSSSNVIVAKPLGVIDGIDYQFTGDVRRVDSHAIKGQLSLNHIVLISPLGYSPTGEAFNLRSEEVATAIATNIKADKLILMTEGNELTTPDKTLIKQLTTHQAESLLGMNKLIDSDSYLHLQEAIRASKLGVERVHLINRKINGGLQLELFTRQGSGTLISIQPFEDARPARIADIQGIIELIRPLESRGLLTYRSAETLEMDIDKFHVIEQDGLITTCAALYPYPEDAMGELACIAVHPDYRSGERGKYLLQLIEKKALALGLAQLFVLTTKSSHWFTERGFSPAPLSQLPNDKKQTYNQTRRSNIFIKNLAL